VGKYYQCKRAGYNMNNHAEASRCIMLPQENLTRTFVDDDIISTNIAERCD